MKQLSLIPLENLGWLQTLEGRLKRRLLSCDPAEFEVVRGALGEVTREIHEVLTEQGQKSLFEEV